MNQQESQRLAKLVEDYRIALKLKPWSEWELLMSDQQRKHGMIPSGRRTGRTQLGILCALAQCDIESRKLLMIEADPSANLDYCVDMAGRSIAALGLPVSVIRFRLDHLGDGRIVHYIDHADRRGPRFK